MNCSALNHLGACFSALLLWIAALGLPIAHGLTSNQTMTRCLSSEPGPFTKVDFKAGRTANEINAHVTVVLGFTDRWLKFKTYALRAESPEGSFWNLFRFSGATAESEELLWFGVSEIAEETGYNGFVYPGFLDLRTPSGEPKRFMLECYVLPETYWRE